MFFIKLLNIFGLRNFYVRLKYPLFLLIELYTNFWSTIISCRRRLTSLLLFFSQNILLMYLCEGILGFTKPFTSFSVFESSFYPFPIYPTNDFLFMSTGYVSTTSFNRYLSLFVFMFFLGGFTRLILSLHIVTTSKFSNYRMYILLF